MYLVWIGVLSWVTEEQWEERELRRIRYSIREYRMIVNVSVPDQRHPDKREKGKARVLIFPQNIF